MLTLDRAVARDPHAGEALAFPWDKLAQYATPRRGQLTMVFGPSGSCKSTFVFEWVQALRLPTLYLSADTDQHDMAYRAICRRREMTLTAVEQGVEVGAIDPVAELADLRGWLWFSFEPSPTIDDLDLELMAFEEAWGAPPEVIVVDTLSDVEVGDDEEVRSAKKVMKNLHHVARSTGAQVIVVHHSTGEFDEAISPPPRRGINGKLSKVPELILSTAINGKFLGFAVVKQRMGFQDIQAKTPIWLSVDPARAMVTNPIEYAYTPEWSQE